MKSKTKLQLDQAVAAQIEAKVKRIVELERCLEKTKSDIAFLYRTASHIQCDVLDGVVRRITRALGKEK